MGPVVVVPLWLTGARLHGRCGVPYNSVCVREFLNAPWLIMQSPFQKPARFAHHILFAWVFVESLTNVAVPEQHHVHVVFVSTALRFHHLLHRRAAVYGAPFIAAFPSKQCLHLPVWQSATLPALKERLISSVLGPETKSSGYWNVLFTRDDAVDTLTVGWTLQYSTYKCGLQLKKNLSSRWVPYQLSRFITASHHVSILPTFIPFCSVQFASSTSLRTSVFVTLCNQTFVNIFDIAQSTTLTLLFVAEMCKLWSAWLYIFLFLLTPPPFTALIFQILFFEAEGELSHLTHSCNPSIQLRITQTF